MSNFQFNFDIIRLMENLRPPYVPVTDLGVLEIPNRRDLGKVIALPTQLVARDAYDQRDEILLAGLTGEGGFNTSALYTFSSRLGVLDHIVGFTPAESGYQGLLQIERTVNHINPLETPEPIGNIKGVLPLGEYYVNDYLRGEPGRHAAEFRLTSDGVYITQQGTEVRVNEQNQDQMDIAVMLLTAAYCQSMVKKIEPTFYTNPRAYPHMELPDALLRFLHGCFLRLHKDKEVI